MKCDCNNGSVVNDIRVPIQYCFALSSPPGQKINKEDRIKLFNKINKSVLSHMTFEVEDDDHKSVDFNGDTTNFTCQLIKTYQTKKCETLNKQTHEKQKKLLNSKLPNQEKYFISTRLLYQLKDLG